jgi:dCMP deaminase
MKYDQYYLDLAERVGANSVDPVFQVGAIIVKDNAIIADGWNGTPSGYKTNQTRDEYGETLYCVVHAESNALAKCARLGLACDGATMYINTGPCPDCAKFIVQAGIKRVVYRRPYRSDTGPALLEEMGVQVERIPE